MAANSSELDTLILRHVGDIEAAYARLYELDERVGAEAHQFLEDCAKAETWFVFNDNDFWIADRDWLNADTARPTPDYWFDFTTSDPDSFWLPALTGSSQQGAQARLTFRIARFGKRKWQQLEPKIAAASQTLLSLGFQRSESLEFFVPVKLDLEKVVEAFENEDFKTALEPFGQAMALIELGHQSFAEIVEEHRRSGQ